MSPMRTKSDYVKQSEDIFNRIVARHEGKRVVARTTRERAARIAAALVVASDKRG